MPAPSQEGTTRLPASLTSREAVPIGGTAATTGTPAARKATSLLGIDATPGFNVTSPHPACATNRSYASGGRNGIRITLRRSRMRTWSAM